MTVEAPILPANKPALNLRLSLQHPSRVYTSYEYGLCVYAKDAGAEMVICELYNSKSIVL